MFFLWREFHGAVVAGHFQVAETAEGLGTALSGEDDGAFPIVGDEFCVAGYFLGDEWSFHFKSDA